MTSRRSLHALLRHLQRFQSDERGVFMLMFAILAIVIVALAGAAVFALTPAATLMFRFNNPDALLVLLLTVPAFQSAFGFGPMGAVDWVVVVFASLAGVIWFEFYKLSSVATSASVPVLSHTSGEQP